MPRLLQSGPRTRPDSESGIVLLFVLFLAALLLIALAVAAPRIATSIQREKEIELVHRGDQYRRAIKLYYRKFGTYPTSIDQLLHTNNIRFLRKRYTDPITGKDDWRIIHLGQAKVPPLGFFGQPLTGMPGPTNVGTPVNATSANPFANATPANLPSNPFPSDNGSGAASPDQSSDTSDSSSAADSSQNAASGASSSPASTPGSASTPTSPFGSNSSSPFGSSTGAGSNLGGGPIVGVGIPSTKASLIDYKKQKHYNQWEFVYNPIEDQMQAAAAALNGGNVQSMSGANNSMGSSSSPFSNSGSSFGNSNGSSSGSSNGSDDNGFGSSPAPINSSPQQQPQ